uniref:Uncharacterized protein n=1 Tax=Oryza brachyantha TaxID=4533 RepID=J3MRB2_ORYBR
MESMSGRPPPPRPDEADGEEEEDDDDDVEEEQDADASGASACPPIITAGGVLGSSEPSPAGLGSLLRCAPPARNSSCVSGGCGEQTAAGVKLV